MKSALSLAFLFLFVAVPACAQKLEGTQCWIGKELVGGFPPNYKCPESDSSGSSGTDSAAHHEAREYSRYVSAYNSALKLRNRAVLAPCSTALPLYQSALTYLDRALQHEPDDSSARRMRREVNASIRTCQGQRAVSNGEYDRGISLFREAQQLYPESNGTWEQNIAWAGRLKEEAKEKARIAQEEQDKDVTYKMRSVLSQASGENTDSSANTSGLEFMGSRRALNEAQSSLTNTGTGLTSTIAEGKTTGRNEEAQKGSRSIFDSYGTATESSINPAVDLRNVGKAPTIVALTSHIPKQAKNDPVIKTSVEWYRRRESDKTETQAKIADVQRQIDSSAGDPGTLQGQKTQLVNELNFIAKDQKTAEDSIKHRLVDLGQPWIEEPEPTPDAGDKKQ
jgi:hypothetical protein